ncbi:hypothetical protein PCANC_17106 [Puccinia coronata f. sp. avenae]|uniref:Uncharacterized protein n=1 Tax=Puccinia coronata f. sp. avenae TaxID=200324 RepID=A0A2N5U566_9BASI|nr:hypothetical protein PCANC_17106 [Puccinia coronata f. sp. avenae]
MVTVKGITHVAQHPRPSRFNNFHISSVHPISVVNNKLEFNYEVELDIITNTPQKKVTPIARWLSFEGPGHFARGEKLVSIQAQSAVYRLNPPDNQLVPHHIKVLGFFKVVIFGNHIEGSDPDKINSCSFLFSPRQKYITLPASGPGDTIWVSGILRRRTREIAYVDAIFIALLDELNHPGRH